MARPPIVPARNPRIPAVPTQPFPLSSQLRFQAHVTIHSIGRLMPEGTMVYAQGARLEPPVVLPIEAALPMVEISAKERGDFAQLDIVGDLFSPQARGHPGGPAPLPRAYRLTWEQGHPRAAEMLSPVARLRPLLEPRVIGQESSTSVLPGELWEHQLEAVNALLAHEAFLLADDTGTGKSVAVCVALAALFQAGKIQRALAIAPESELRTLAGRLAAWAPGVLVTAVHGNPELRALDWQMPTQIHLVSYEDIVEDLESGALDEDHLDFDVVLLDDVPVTGLRFQRFPDPIRRLRAARRWAIAGALPSKAEDWLALFSFLTPRDVQGAKGITLPDLKRRFRPYLLRRTKSMLRETLPQRRRQTLWIDLDRDHRQAYEEAMAEERHRLAQLGASVTTAHIEAAVDRLKQLCNFSGEGLDSAKLRSLVTLVDQIAAAGEKIVVFTHYREQGLDRLQPALEPFGVLRLDTESDEEQRQRILEAFRTQEHWHVLLLDMGARTDGEPLVEASYLAHFDHSWNSAVRLRAERRLHPLIFRAVPVNIYEFWVADTIDENLHRLLAEKDLLPSDMPEDTQPLELEGRLTIAEWLEKVLEVPEEEAARVPSKATGGTGLLPGTSVLRSWLTDLSPTTLMEAVETVMRALGYPEVEMLDEPDEEGGYLLAWRQEEEGVERVLVRCLRAEGNVGVAKARALLKAMEMRRDCAGAFLVVTTDFTAACRKLAEESEGRLELVTGPELYRHLHILGQV